MRTTSNFMTDTQIAALDDFIKEYRIESKPTKFLFESILLNSTKLIPTLHGKNLCRS